MTLEFTAENVRTLRDATGHGLQLVCKAFELAKSEDRFKRDPILALAFLDRMGLAIMIHGDKEAWALEGASDLAMRFRAQVDAYRTGVEVGRSLGASGP